jgi:hypothetical protein
MFLGVSAYLGANGSKDYYKFIKSLDDNPVKAKRDVLIGRILTGITIAIHLALRFIGLSAQYN